MKKLWRRSGWRSQYDRVHMTKLIIRTIKRVVNSIFIEIWKKFEKKKKNFKRKNVGGNSSVPHAKLGPIFPPSNSFLSLQSKSQISSMEMETHPTDSAPISPNHLRAGEGLAPLRSSLTTRPPDSPLQARLSMKLFPAPREVGGFEGLGLGFAGRDRWDKDEREKWEDLRDLV